MKRYDNFWQRYPISWHHVGSFQYCAENIHYNKHCSFSVDLLCWFVLSFYIHWHSQIKWLIISILFSLTNKCWWTYDVCDTARWIKHVRHFQLQPLIVATLSKFQLEIYIMKQSHLLRICAWSTHKLNVLSAIFANKRLAIREYQHRQRHWNQIWHKKIMQPDETANARNAHGSS